MSFNGAHRVAVIVFGSSLALPSYGGVVSVRLGPIAPGVPAIYWSRRDLERPGTLAHQIDCVAGIRWLPDLRAQNVYSCGISLQ